MRPACKGQHLSHITLREHVSDGHEGCSSTRLNSERHLVQVYETRDLPQQGLEGAAASLQRKAPVTRHV